MYIRFIRQALKLERENPDLSSKLERNRKRILRNRIFFEYLMPPMYATIIKMYHKIDGVDYKLFPYRKVAMHYDLDTEVIPEMIRKGLHWFNKHLRLISSYYSPYSMNK